MRALYLKLRIKVLETIQKSFGLFGLQIRRLKPLVSVENADTEVSRLAGKHVNCIVEFGAADGRDAEIFAQTYPQAKVLAIEPVPSSFDKLDARRVRAPNLITLQAAVSDTNDEASFFLSSEVDASSLSPPVKTGSAFDKHAEQVGRITVKQVTLDSVCTDYSIASIDILKMDAQGAELVAMHGAKEVLARNGIGTIITEIQFIRLYERACLFHELWAFLQKHGFYLHGVYNLSHNEHGQLCWGDAVFVHESRRPARATIAFAGTRA